MDSLRSSQEKKRRAERAKKEKGKRKPSAKEEPKAAAKKAEAPKAKAKAKEEDDIVEEDFEDNEVSIEVPEVMAEDLYDDMKKPKAKDDDDDRWGNAGGPPGARPEPDLSMPPGKKAIDSTSEDNSVKGKVRKARLRDHGALH